MPKLCARELISHYDHNPLWTELVIKLFGKKGGDNMPDCQHIQYTGGTYNAYYCDLCPLKKFDFDSIEVKNVCKGPNEAYRKCEIWIEKA